jgi:hypothetical protein
MRSSLLGILLALVLAPAAGAQTLTAFKINVRAPALGLNLTPSGTFLLETSDATTADTVAKIGTTFPLYLKTNWPGIGFNIGESGKYGATQFGGFLGFDNAGALTYYTAPSGTAGTVATLTPKLTISQTGRASFSPTASANGAVPAGLQVNSGTVTDATGVDRPLFNASIVANGNTESLSIREHVNVGASAWTGIALGVQYDVDGVVGAGPGIWFYNTGSAPNIGINNTAPTATLDVNGSLRVGTAFPFLLSCSGSLAALATTYFFAPGVSTGSATTFSNQNQTVMPFAGKVSAVYWRAATAPAGPYTMSWLLTKNGTNGASMGSGNTQTGSVTGISSNNTFAAGDGLSCGITTGGSGPSPGQTEITYLIQPQ